MFTGIIESLGTVADRRDHDSGVVLTIDAGEWGFHPQAGDSIAVNGCCLTATSASSPGRLIFDVIPQTLRATSLGDLVTGSPVNLERPVTPATLMSGHVVQGHIDGVGAVIQRTDGDECRLRIQPPEDLQVVIIARGSVAVDGVSLTVAAVTDDSFEVALIPETLARTNLGTVRQGSRVNLEADYLARIVVSWLERQAKSP